MNVPLLAFRRVHGGVEITRGPGVADELWMRVRAEWGSDGADPLHRIVVGTDTFLARLAWLRPACVEYGVGVDPDDGCRDLLVAVQVERRALDAALAEAPT